jgi:hypothetical protein
MNRALALRMLIAAAIAGACVASFFACFEKRETVIDSPLAAEARRNRHLALGRLLERMGHEVAVHENFEALGELPDPPATVFLTSNRTTLGRERSEALLAWVARGGHLVVQTFTVWESGEGGEKIASGRPDLLLDRFGLRQRQSPNLINALDPEEDDGAGEDDSAPDESGRAEREPAPEAEDESVRLRIAKPEPAWAYLDEGEDPFKLTFTPSFWWDDPDGVAVWSVSSDAGMHLVEVAHGEGRIAALTSEEPLLNGTIGEVDHAEFVVRWLRDGRERSTPVWIFVREEWPGVLALLRQHAWPALVAGALLLALWLWRSLWRFGPALPSPEPARRRWLEHLEAAGRYHWRQDRGAALLAALRGELERELARKRPAWQRLPGRERLDRLAHTSGLSQGEVAHALTSLPRAPKTFSAAVRWLERIRAAL